MYAELKRKVCLQCKEEKSLDLFRFRKDKRTYESYCKACESNNCKNWYKTNKQALKDKDFVRNCKKFGLTVDEYKQMVKIQNGLCAICNKPETQKRDGIIKNLAIDHCHTTGQIRSLLCNNCNTSIGLIKEDIEISQSVTKYLIKFKK